MKVDNEKKKTDTEGLQEAIDALAKELEFHDPDSDEAKAICENIRTLSEAKANLMKAKPQTKLSMNTLTESLVSLAGVVLLGSFEKVSILPAKATTLLMKMFKSKK